MWNEKTKMKNHIWAFAKSNSNFATSNGTNCRRDSSPWNQRMQNTISSLCCRHRRRRFFFSTIPAVARRSFSHSHFFLFLHIFCALLLQFFQLIRFGFGWLCVFFSHLPHSFVSLFVYFRCCRLTSRLRPAILNRFSANDKKKRRNEKKTTDRSLRRHRTKDPRASMMIEMNMCNTLH